MRLIIEKDVSKRLLRLCLILILSVPVMAADMPQHALLKRALKERKDISKEALKVMKSWLYPGVGVPHSGWIENEFGKSIDLQGNMLFPEQDYVHMKQIMDGVYMLENRQHKKCVISAQGHMMLPFVYDHISVQETWGVIKGMKGSRSSCDVDYYSTDGLFLFTAEGIEWDEGSDATGCHFDFENNVFTYKLKGQWHYADATGNETTSKSLPASQSRLFRCEKEEMERRGRIEYANNVWIKMADEAMQAGKYKKALDYLDYYQRFDYLGSSSFFTSANILFYTTAMKCAYALHDYDYIVEDSYFPGNGYQLSFSSLNSYIEKDASGRAVISDYYKQLKNGLVAPSAQAETEMLLNVCCDIYNAALANKSRKTTRVNIYKGGFTQPVINTSTWNQVITTVGQSIQNTAADFKFNSAGVLPEGMVVSGSVPTEENYQSHQEDTREEPLKKMCRSCLGNGRCPLCNGKGYYIPSIGAPEVKCNKCHQSGVCTLCNGTGKYGYVR